MIYKFVIVSDESDNFKLQIAIDSTATFMQLRNVILDSAGYSKEQMDSFYICDDEWNKEKEVTCIDMDTDSDEDIWIMDDTQLDELIEDEGQRLKFVFDYMTERYFKVKLKEVIPGKSLHDPCASARQAPLPPRMLTSPTSSPSPSFPTPPRLSPSTGANSTATRSMTRTRFQTLRNLTASPATTINLGIDFEVSKRNYNFAALKQTTQT